MASVDARDKKGLLAKEGKTEAQARAFYTKMLALFSLVLGPGVATMVWVLVSSHSPVVRAKLAAAREYDLGYVFAAWWACFVGRSLATLNANGARGPSRVGRPDQHVYQIMAESGTLADAPYVLMASAGAVGRFNRAQRACANIDEALPLFLTGLLSNAVVFGPPAFVLALLFVYGSVRFAHDYKNDLDARISGFFCMMLASQTSAGFVALAAILTLFGASSS